MSSTYESNPAHMMSADEKAGTKKVWNVRREVEHLEAHKMAQDRAIDVGAVRAAQAYKRQHRKAAQAADTAARHAEQQRQAREYAIQHGIPVPPGAPTSVAAPAPLPPAPNVVASSGLPPTTEGVIEELARAQEAEAAKKRGTK